MVEPKSGKSKNEDLLGDASLLVVIGGLHLEFVYLSSASADPKYADKVCKIRKHLDRMDKPFGALYYVFVNTKDGQWGVHYLTLGDLSNTFYEYLIKSWIQSNGSDIEGRRMFDAAADALEKHMIKRSHSGQ